VVTFVVPALDGPITGGTRYNGELLRALGELGVSVRAVDLDAARRLPAGDGRTFVDSLFLREVPELRASSGAGAKLGLILHYVPSLVARALGEDPGPLERMEADAFACVDAIIVPSVLAKRSLERRGVERPSVVAIEPGCTIRPAVQAPSVERAAALVVSNLVRNKGIFEFLRALGEVVSASDDFTLSIVGGESAEPAYARTCKAFAEAHEGLRTRIRFEGAVEPASMGERLGRSNVFVSASFTETYGMALGEARAGGVPILALDAGSTRAHVAPEAAGELLETHRELAHAFVRLCRDRTELGRRVEAARAYALSNEPRSWNDAAREFQEAFGAEG
jgi:glycosyltransferase involved in cell wall biosynthesis